MRHWARTKPKRVFLVDPETVDIEAMASRLDRMGLFPGSWLMPCEKPTQSVIECTVEDRSRRFVSHSPCHRSSR